MSKSTEFDKNLKRVAGRGRMGEYEMLKVTLKEGESLAIGGNITVELKQIATSRRATILINAPREVPVKRQKAETEAVGAVGK